MITGLDFIDKYIKEESNHWEKGYKGMIAKLMESYLVEYKHLNNDEDIVIFDLKPIFTNDQLHTISVNIRTYGGSFMTKIGEALMHADEINKRKLSQIYENEFREYLLMQ